MLFELLQYIGIDLVLDGSPLVDTATLALKWMSPLPKLLVVQVVIKVSLLGIAPGLQHNLFRILRPLLVPQLRLNVVFVVVIFHYLRRVPDEGL